MKTERWSLQDAKNKFSAVVDAARKGKAQVVTRRGVPAAVVVSIEDFEKLQQFEASQSPSFIDHLFSMPTDDGVFGSAVVNPGILNNALFAGHRLSISVEKLPVASCQRLSYQLF